MNEKIWIVVSALGGTLVALMVDQTVKFRDALMIIGIGVLTSFFVIPAITKQFDLNTEWSCLVSFFTGLVAHVAMPKVKAILARKVQEKAENMNL